MSARCPYNTPPMLASFLAELDRKHKSSAANSGQVSRSTLASGSPVSRRSGRRRAGRGTQPQGGAARSPRCAGCARQSRRSSWRRRCARCVATGRRTGTTTTSSLRRAPSCTCRRWCSSRFEAAVSRRSGRRLGHLPGRRRGGSIVLDSGTPLRRPPWSGTSATRSSARRRSSRSTATAWAILRRLGSQFDMSAGVSRDCTSIRPWAGPRHPLERRGGDRIPPEPGDAGRIPGRVLQGGLDHEGAQCGIPPTRLEHEGSSLPEAIRGRSCAHPQTTHHIVAARQPGCLAMKTSIDGSCRHRDPGAASAAIGAFQAVLGFLGRRVSRCRNRPGRSPVGGRSDARRSAGGSVRRQAPARRRPTRRRRRNRCCRTATRPARRRGSCRADG